MAIFKTTKKYYKNNQRDHLVVYSRFQRLSHLTLDNKSELLDYGISYKICFTNECLELWKAWQRPSLFCLSFPICRTYNHCILRFACSISPHKLPNIKFSLAPIIVHEADFSKHRPLFPTLIMYSTNRPHAACNNVKKGINFTLQCCGRMGGVGAVGCKTLILCV